jgi:RNA polymerase sigma-70 factor (ECF subfamily)
LNLQNALSATAIIHLIREWKAMSLEVISYFPNSFAGADGDTSAAADQSVKPPSEMPSDEFLLQAVGAGSREALSLLFRRHARAVFHLAHRILRDESEADDLRQEVFLFLFERAQQFDAQKGTGSSWIMQVTYHRAIDRRRYLGFRQHYTAEAFDEQRVLSATTQPSLDTLDGKEIRDRLREQLTEDQQETLELHFFEGYSLREIAEKRGQTVGNVRHHYYRALERLRSHLFRQKRG